MNGTPDVVERTVLLIDETPFVFWGRIAEVRRRHLAGIDAGYWDYQARIHAEQIRTSQDSAQHAAAALRVAYGQGVETLLAMLCALAQAPWFAVGWMSRYKNSDLRHVVDKIHNNKRVPNAWGHPSPSWELLSQVVHAFVPEPTKTETQVVSRLAAAWRQSAAEFLDRHFEPEYNSLKHGMRGSVGPFALSIGGVGENDKNPLARTAALVGRAEFGSTFRVSQKTPGSRHSFEFVEETSRRWSPPQFVTGLQIIGTSIANVVSRLRTLDGEDPAGLPFSCATDHEVVQRVWHDDTQDAWLGHVTFSEHVESTTLPPEPTAAQIRTEYEALTRGRRRAAGTSAGAHDPGAGRSDKTDPS